MKELFTPSLERKRYDPREELLVPSRLGRDEGSRYSTRVGSVPQRTRCNLTSGDNVWVVTGSLEEGSLVGHWTSLVVVPGSLSPLRGKDPPTPSSVPLPRPTESTSGQRLGSR